MSTTAARSSHSVMSLAAIKGNNNLYFGYTILKDDETTMSTTINRYYDETEFMSTLSHHQTNIYDSGTAPSNPATTYGSSFYEITEDKGDAKTRLVISSFDYNERLVGVGHRML